jgi:CBS domain-containing protein
MSCIRAKDIMHPGVSVFAKDRGSDVVKKLTGISPALPVVNDDCVVVGIVSEYDIMIALKEERVLDEFSAESIMSCGHEEHERLCEEPLSITPDTPIDNIVFLFLDSGVSLLPVTEHKKLVGIIGRSNIMYALSERGLWPEHELEMRV